MVCVSQIFPLVMANAPLLAGKELADLVLTATLVSRPT